MPFLGKRQIDILIQPGGNLLHLERREKPVIDALLEGIDIDRLPEVAAGIHVVRALGRGGEAQLNDRGEVVQDPAPVAFVVGTAAMAFVNDDEIKEVRRVSGGGEGTGESILPGSSETEPLIRDCKGGVTDGHSDILLRVPKGNHGGFENTI